MLAELLRARAAATPSRPAFVVAGGATLSFGRWESRSAAVAGGLRRRGVGPDDRVVLRFDVEDFGELAVAAAGVHRAGAVMVPVPAHATSVELDRVVRHSEAAAVLEADTLVQVEREGALDAPGGKPEPPAAETLELSYRLLPLRPAGGVPHQAEGVLSALAGLDRGAEAPSMLHASAVGTDVARWALWFPLRPGRGPVLTVPGADPRLICAASATHGVARWVLDPAVAAFVLDTGAADEEDLSALVQIVLAGGPTPPDLRSRLGARFPTASIDVRVPLGHPGQGEATSAPGPDEAPVATSQEGMLWQEQLVPGSQNLPPLVRRYRGPLDLEVLGRVLTEIVRRHEPLRTTFALRDGKAVQVVSGANAVPLDVRDLTGRAAAEQAEEVDRFLDEARRPLDLVDGPLFEPTVFRMGPDDHVVAFRVHHSVYDDWSVGVFRRELSRLYPALAAGDPSPLPELPVSFLDFARAQRRRLEGDAGARDMAWWKAHLAGAPLALQVPVDDPALPAGAPQASPEPVTVRVPREVHLQLQALARRERTTVFAAVLAATAALLGRYTGQSELLLASVVANRNRVELEGMVGCFTKKVLLRVDLGGAPTFTELLARARSALLGALSHQDLAFEAVLQDVLGPAAAASGVVPQAAVMVQGVTPGAGDVVLPGLTTEGFDTSTTTRRAHFAAGDDGAESSRAGPPWGAGVYLGTFLILSVVQAGGDLSLVARGAFWRPAVERLLAELAALLSDALAHPSRPMAELGRERDERAEDAVAGADPEGSLDRRFVELAARASSEAAVRDGRQVLTFAQLDARVDALAGRLRDAGAAPGGFVGIALAPSVACVVGVLAVWRAGAAYVGVEADDDRDHLASVLDGAGVQVVLAADDVPATLFGSGRRLVAVGEEGDDAVPAPRRARPDVGPDAAALAFHGCGSTAVPGGVVLDHGAVNGLLAGLRKAVLQPALAATGRDRLRIAFSAAPTQDAFLRQLVGLLDGHVLIAGAGPVDVVDAPAEDLADLGQPLPPVVVVGSRLATGRDERIPSALLQHSVVHRLFGPPECGFAATSELLAERGPRLTIGRPLVHVTAEVLDPAGSAVPVQVPGELHLGGAGLARRAGRDDPRRHPTGLVARHLPDGRIEVLGPVAGTVLLRGLRVDRLRLEAALARHPSVRRVALTVEEAGPGDPHLVAHVVPEGDEHPTLAELRVHLWRELPGCPWPRALVLSNGSRSPVTAGFGPPTPEEALLARLWADALSVEALPVETNYWQRFSFLDAVARAREAGLRVGARQVSRNRTIAGLAADLASGRDVGRAGASRLQSEPF
ncbi:MAG TPA: condensation domain-containing protein [Acidimicrobiales bacterium]|nr:condensation domain-containing protein [Acidimicrobiales bacterium]